MGLAAVHAEVEFIGIALGGLLSEDLKAGFLLVVVFGAKRVVLGAWSIILGGKVLCRVRRKEGAYFVFLEDTPFLSFFGLGALFVVPPLDSVAHRRHYG